MIKYICDKCGDEIEKDQERWLFKVKETNVFKEDHTVCLCGVCRQVYVNAIFFKIGHIRKDKL